MTTVFEKMTLESLRTAYAAGATVEDTLREVWRRIEARGDDGAWIWRPQWDELLAMARQIASDPATQPLYGVPFAVKDNIDVVGWPTTAGCEAFGHVAEADAAVIAKLKAAGAIPIGKTNLDQFATGLVGTRSPYGVPSSVFSAAHVSGGSSSGSAVAVAAGEVAFSLGTDTAGSGRVPAAFNELVGLKPSLGLVSPRGVVPACRSLDCVSIFAHSASDAAAVLTVAQGFDAAEPFSRRVTPRPVAAVPRLGVPRPDQREFFGDAAAAEAYAAALEKVKALGWSLVEIDFAPFAEMARQLYAGPWVAERLAAVEEFHAQSAEEMHPVVREIIGGAAKLSAVEAFRGLYERERLRRATEAVWSGIDALFLPTAPTHPTIEAVLADPIRLNSQLGTYTNFVNLLELAAVAVPGPRRRDGLPFGVTFMAPAGSDGGLLGLATQWGGEKATIPPDAGLVRLAVVGAHLRGQPLHGQLTERGAAFLALAKTAPCYRLHALANTTPPKPGLVRDEDFSGAGLEVEVYALTPEAFGSFTALVPPPLAIGNVQLADGSWVKGFVCEPCGLEGAREITALGGWRAFLAS